MSIHASVPARRTGVEGQFTTEYSRMRAVQESMKSVTQAVMGKSQIKSQIPKQQTT